jgi:hypothetical protein
MTISIEQQMNDNLKKVEIHSWIESSNAEVDLAADVAAIVKSATSDTDVITQVVDLLAIQIIREEVPDNVTVMATQIVGELVDTFPQLGELDTATPFPQTHLDLTSNFFSRLAYELSAMHNNPLDYGVVNTPAVIAKDMVALAAGIWLIPQAKMAEASIWNLVFGHEDPLPGNVALLTEILSKAKWYDPCIGGGVFPIAVLLLLTHFGIPLTGQISNIICGMDRDRLAVTATNIRVALLLHHLTKKSYTKVQQQVKGAFQVGDSLVACTEQGTSLFASPESILPGQVDLIIGNPPYVRADRIAPTVKNFLKNAYPSVAGGTTDLYNYFIAHGLIALKKGGVLCYISPASFQKSKYGEKTRRYVDVHGSVRVIFDFNELPVFNDVSIHSSVYVIAKDIDQEVVSAYTFNELPKQNPLLLGITHSHTMPRSNTGVSAWHINHFATSTLVDMLHENAIPLKHYAGGIFSGIKTGHKKAYNLDCNVAGALLSDPLSKPFIKPLLRPVSIRTWHSEWDGTHLALIKKGECVPAQSLLMQHLKRYEVELRERTDVQGHSTWYGLRACDYYHLFEKPKIIFPDIASECRFAIDTEGHIISDGAFLLPTSDYFLLGILNSCVGRFYFRARCNSIGNVAKGGRLRFKKTYVENFPVPRVTSQKSTEIREEIAALAKILATKKTEVNLLSKIDMLTLQLYMVSQQHWTAFLEES